jgi:Lipocalin-like domain
MRFGILIVVCSVTVAFGQTPRPSNSAGGENQHRTAVADHGVSEQLVGAWRLVSVETTLANGEVIYPFYGKHPEGLLIYDRSGWMSLQIVSDPQPSVPVTSSREGFLAAPPAEKVTAIDGYYAYYGTWSVDASGTSVTHHLHQSLYPGERGDDAIRMLSLEANRLTLVAKAHEMGEDHQRRLVWERVSPAGH